VINLWQLQVFLVVYETGSFSAAATRLHMTQPGVSQQIRSLENHFGSQLFLRRGHGVELTAEGEELLDPARRLLNLSETIERTAISRRGEVSGRVRLGCALSSGTYIFNSWLSEFRTRHPHVSFQVEQMEPGPLIGSLRAQELDGGLVLGRTRGRGLLHHKVMEDPVTLIVPLNHPWTYSGQLGRARSDGLHVGTRASQSARASSSDGFKDGRHDDDGWVPAVKPQMLKEQPVILEHGIGESHSDARRALNDALEERGLTTRDLRIALELPNPMSVACAVAEGLGVGFVPQSIARRLVGQVVPVRVEGLTLSQHVYLIHDRKALHSPAVEAWWKFVGAKVGQHPEGEQPPGQKSDGLTPPKPKSRAEGRGR
jgi:DNA-binding transcriptional LysR family regulator